MRWGGKTPVDHLTNTIGPVFYQRIVLLLLTNHLLYVPMNVSTSRGEPHFIPPIVLYD